MIYPVMNILVQRLEKYPKQIKNWSWQESVTTVSRIKPYHNILEQVLIEDTVVLLIRNLILRNLHYLVIQNIATTIV